MGPTASGSATCGAKDAAVVLEVVVMVMVVEFLFGGRGGELRRGVAGEDAELARGVGEEADLALAVLAVLAGLGAVAGGVEPALEDAVGELAGVAAGAAAATVVGADGAGVVVAAGVAAAGLLARVGEGAVGPVMAAAARAPPDLELVHAEVVGGVGVVAGVGVGVAGAGVVVGEVFLEEGLVGQHVGGRGEVLAVAGEELPRWDFYVSQEMAELVLLRTDAAHHINISNIYIYVCVCVYVCIVGRREW